MKWSLRQIAEMVAAKRAGSREEYCWYYLKQNWPGAHEAALQRWADGILALTGE